MYVPLVPAYLSIDGPVTWIGIAIELVFLLDVLVTLNTSYVDQDSEAIVSSRYRIFTNYMRGWMIPDLISSIPIDLIRWLTSQPLITTDSNVIATDEAIVSVVVHSILQFPRLVSTVRLISRMWNICRMLRIGKSIYTWLFYSRYSHLMRIVRMVLLVLLTAHYIGCGWHLVTGENNPNAPNAVPPGSPMLDQYVADVYYAMLLIQGQGDPSNTTVQQNAYAIVAVLLGSLMVAIVFANITVLVSNFSANSTNYQRKMEVVHATMDKMQLPPELQERVQRYYSHLWQQYDSLDGDINHFLKELTPTLALEVGLFKHMALITKVPFWSSCSPDFMAHVVRNLVVQVYMPDDYVVRRGEHHRDVSELSASQQFLRLSSSSMRVHPQQPGDRANFLGSGQAFSEMALLTNYEQSASIRAATFVEMCVLPRRPFQSLLAQFPNDRCAVLTAMLRSSIESKDIPLSWAEALELVAAHRGGNRSWQDAECEPPDNDEIVRALVKEIDHEEVDKSIVFGLPDLRTGRQNCHDTGSNRNLNELHQASTGVTETPRTGSCQSSHNCPFASVTPAEHGVSTNLHGTNSVSPVPIQCGLRRRWSRDSVKPFIQFNDSAIAKAQIQADNLERQLNRLAADQERLLALAFRRKQLASVPSTPPAVVLTHKMRSVPVLPTVSDSPEHATPPTVSSYERPKRPTTQPLIHIASQRRSLQRSQSVVVATTIPPALTTACSGDTDTRAKPPLPNGHLEHAERTPAGNAWYRTACGNLQALARRASTTTAAGDLKCRDGASTLADQLWGSLAPQPEHPTVGQVTREPATVGE